MVSIGTLFLNLVQISNMFNKTKQINLYTRLSTFRYSITPSVRCSAEAGWLIGTLERNGQRGLLPENYVMFI